MIKSIKTILAQDKEKFKVPNKVQDLIPIKCIWPDGIFKIGNKFSKTYKFSDINYLVASREDKESMFLTYSELLNSLDSGATTKITINNHRLNKADFEDSILMPLKHDGLDGYRIEYNDMKRIIAITLSALMLFIVCSCAKPNDGIMGNTDTTDITTNDDTSLESDDSKDTNSGNSGTNDPPSSDDTPTTPEQPTAIDLNAYITNNTGYCVEIITDSESTTEFEILIGNTERTELSVDENGYKIELDGSRLAIVADNVYAYELALGRFTEQYDNNQKVNTLSIRGTNTMLLDKATGANGITQEK